MLIFIVEAVFSFIALALILYFKILSRPQMGEGQVGPFTVVYMKDMSSTWSTAKKIKEVKNYLASKNITSDIYVRYYMEDPSKSTNKAIPSIIGAVIEQQSIPGLKEPFAIKTLPARYVAFAANENRLLGMNIKVLYPRLFAYMDVMNYKPDSNKYLELYHMSEEDNGFGKGYYTRICCRIRDKTEEEQQKDSKKKVYDVNAMIFGKKSGFGKGQD